MSPRLVVITVNYCCADAILAGLDTTVAQLRQLGDAVYWIVDNRSPDGSAQALMQAVADRGCGDIVTVMSADTNGGFGAGNNVAIRQAMAVAQPPDYFYFLNPDAIPQPGAIAALVDLMDARPEAGIAGGLLCDEQGDIESSLFRFPSFWSEVETAISLGAVRRLLRRHVVTVETPEEPTAVDWVAGTSFIARATALKAVGEFDETFFLYWEEIELCHRIKAAEFQIYGVPDAIVMHTGGVSTGMHRPEKRIPSYWFASRNYFFRSTGRGGPLPILNLAVTVGLCVRRMHQALRGRRLRPPHYLRDFLRYSMTMPNGPAHKEDIR